MTDLIFLFKMVGLGSPVRGHRKDSPRTELAPSVPSHFQAQLHMHSLFGSVFWHLCSFLGETSGKTYGRL